MYREEEYPIKDNGFEYLGKHYDCQYAIKRDIKMVLQEAETSHKDFDELYDRNTLRPHKIRLRIDENNTPIYGIIIYLIDYKERNSFSRLACGGYYIFRFDNLILYPHPYQESICW